MKNGTTIFAVLCFIIIVLGSLVIEQFIENNSKPTTPTPASLFCTITSASLLQEAPGVAFDKELVLLGNSIKVQVLDIVSWCNNTDCYVYLRIVFEDSTGYVPYDKCVIIK